MQLTTIFSGGVASACMRPDAARALLAFLASPAAEAAMRRYGMAPA